MLWLCVGGLMAVHYIIQKRIHNMIIIGLCIDPWWQCVMNQGLWLILLCPSKNKCSQSPRLVLRLLESLNTDMILRSSSHRAYEIAKDLWDTMIGKIYGPFKFRHILDTWLIMRTALSNAAVWMRRIKRQNQACVYCFFVPNTYRLCETGKVPTGLEARDKNEKRLCERTRQHCQSRRNLQLACLKKLVHMSRTVGHFPRGDWTGNLSGLSILN